MTERAAVRAFAVTGAGVVSAAGIGVPSLRDALRAGRSHIGTFEAPGAASAATRHPGARFCPEFATAHPEPEHAAAASRLALEEALEAARLPSSSRRSLAFGSALAGIHDGSTLAFDGDGRAAFASTDRLAASLADRYALTIRAGAACSATCVSANYALEHACAELILDRADAVVVGGVDTLSPVMRAGFSTLGALAGPSDGTPTGVVSAGATLGDGLVLGEAACFVVLERLDDAIRRGVDVLAVVDGRGQCADAVHLTAPDENGAGMARAIRDCLGDAGIGSEAVDRVSVTATDSTRYARMYERVLADVFGTDGVECAHWEGSVGHVLAATATFGLVYAALRFEDEPGRQLALTVGFGGQNGVVSLRSATNEDGR